jgi:hypothetical protein
MGSHIELNDTLQITTAQGFPEKLLSLKKHQKKPITLKDVKGKVFSFKNKSGARVFHTQPTRCFLVHNINGRWLYWGHILMLEQTISGGFTAGKYKIIQIYEPEYQKQITRHESPEGQSYF